MTLEGAPSVAIEGTWAATAEASVAGSAQTVIACASVGPCASGGATTTATAAEGAGGVVIVEASGAGGAVYGGSAYVADGVGAAHPGGAGLPADAVVADATLDVSTASWSSASAGQGSAGASAISPDRAAAAIGVTGRGRGLLAIAGEGVTVEGRIAALDLLAALAGASFEASARVGGDASFTCDASLAHDALPAAGGETSVVLRVAGGGAPARVPPMRVHLVIDASTSMQSTWGDLQDAALHLVARLRPEDELQIVVYGTDAREALAPIRVGDGAEARRVIRALRPGGRTHIEAGLRIAYRAIRPQASIVVLLSDGVPNGGLATAAELGALAAEANARGATTTAIGIGWDFHPGILRSIAERGHGGFRIAPRVIELGAILEAEITARARIAAHDVRISVRVGPGVRIREEALPAGVETTADGAVLVVPALAAGEEQIVVIPVEIPPGADARTVAWVDAAWTPLAAGARTQRATKSLALAVAPEPVLAGGALAVLDADLRSALTLSAEAVANGDARAAAAALRAHADRATVHVRVRPMAALTARTEHVRVLATALEQLVPAASWHDRRALGASMISFSASF